MNQPVILASKSPWRKRLLKKYGISAKVHVSNFDEIFKAKTPKDIVLHNAVGKAEFVAKHYKKGIIIGVDTIGVHKGKILTKPKDKDDARRMLGRLSGQTHEVISGVCVIDLATGKKYIFADTTKVIFNKIEKSELEKYLASNQWVGKAGAYAVQARAKKFVKKIDGDITNVVGIPMVKLKKIFIKMTAQK
ncbi:MAG: Maf family protein [Candidatus Gracilibacteria bacterium]